MSNSANATHVSLTEAKQRLGELVKRAAYGGERIVLEFRGKPVATIEGFQNAEPLDGKDREELLEDLKSLRERGTAYRKSSLEELREQIETRSRAERDEQRRRMDDALIRMKAGRNEIAARRGSHLPDSAELLREARDERDDQLSGLS